MSPSPAVLLPGTASDEVFVARVFGRPLTEAGFAPATPAVRGVRECHEALDAAWSGTPLLVGGISLGAHVATAWAVRHPGRCAGVLAALAAWLGPAGGAP
ncbi:alpha/beta hydrolase, partial [Saccharothrix lopnurensis]